MNISFVDCGGNFVALGKQNVDGKTKQRNGNLVMLSNKYYSSNILIL